MKHYKKILPEYFEMIKEGKKCYELRLADWECKAGDILVLKEWDEKKQKYTGRKIEKVVVDVLKTKNLNFYKKEEVEKYGFQIITIK